LIPDNLLTYLKLADKIGLRYELSRPFGEFLDSVISAPSLNLVYLGSGLIDHSQNMTVAASAMADMNVWAHRS
jgi:hypothetical protein